MDAAELIKGFLSSEHGAQAMSALQAQGITPDAAQTYLTHATQAVADHTHEQASSSGLLGDHPGKSFFAAFAAGLVKGDGVFGALEDGALGVVTGRVAEAIASRAGVDEGHCGDDRGCVFRRIRRAVPTKSDGLFRRNPTAACPVKCSNRAARSRQPLVGGVGLPRPENQASDARGRVRGETATSSPS